MSRVHKDEHQRQIDDRNPDEVFQKVVPISRRRVDRGVRVVHCMLRPERASVLKAMKPVVEDVEGKQAEKNR